MKNGIAVNITNNLNIGKFDGVFIFSKSETRQTGIDKSDILKMLDLLTSTDHYHMHGWSVYSEGITTTANGFIVSDVNWEINNNLTVRIEQVVLDFLSGKTEVNDRNIYYGENVTVYIGKQPPVK